MAEDLQQFDDEVPAVNRPPRTRDQIRSELAKRVGVPVPRRTRKGPQEIATRQATFHDKTQEEVVLLTAKLVKASSAATFASLRSIRDLQSVVDLNSLALAQLQDDLKQVRRATARLDRPLGIVETTDNPNLNPLLAGQIPFNDMQGAVHFLLSTERTTALQRFLWVQIKWSESNFPAEMVRLLFTYDFRERYNWPGDLQYKNQAYLPEKLKQFLVNVIAFVARKSGGHFNRARVERQLRVLFHASQVAKERANDEAKKRALAKAQEKEAVAGPSGAVLRKRAASAPDDDEPGAKKKVTAGQRVKKSKKKEDSDEEERPADA